MYDEQKEIEALRNEIAELRNMVMLSQLREENDTFLGQNDDSLNVIGGVGGDAGCWLVDYDDDQGITTFKNCYYSIGGNLYDYGTCDFNILSDAVNPEGDPSGDKPYVYLKVFMKDTDDGYIRGEAEVKSANSWSSISAISRNVAFYIKPLYKFNHDGSVAIDYRNMPGISSIEF